jgi:solute:Na+ symporter, SSS family
LKACAWADLLQGSALIVGGGIITYFAFDALGGADPATLLQSTGDASNIDVGTGAIARFSTLNKEAMHVVTKDPDVMPWPILLLGIWIPNFYYWGLNQYITQRILGSGSLKEGQKGLVLAAGLKLIIPFIIVIPGIIAFNLFSPKLADYQTDASRKSVLKSFDAESVKADSKKVYTLDENWIKNEKNAELAAKIEAHNSKVTASLGKDKVEVVDATGNVFANFNKAQAKLDAILKDPKRVAEYAEAKVSKTSIDPKLSKFELDVKYVKANPEANQRVVAYNTAAVALAGINVSLKAEKINVYKYDNALTVLITELIPKNVGILGFVIAALLGAIISSLAAVLNATSTLFTMDIYQRYIRPEAKQFEFVTVGRICIGVFVIVGCVLAPILDQFDSIFEYIQKSQGYISTGIFTVFLYGLLNRKSGRSAGVFGLLMGPVLYAVYQNNLDLIGIKLFEKTPHFLYSMSYTILTLLGLLFIYGLIFRSKEAVVFTSNTTLDMTPSKPALYWGILICILTVVLYIIFW